MSTDTGVTADTPSRTKRKGRWLQFSPWTLLVLILAFGAGLGWFAREVQRTQTRREAVTAVVNLEGVVKYKSRGTAQTVAAWAGKLLGEDLAEAVTLVHLSRTQVSDAGLEHLRGLTKLESLSLDYTQVTEVGLEHLRGLTRLKSLSLNYTQVADAGLEYLREMTGLQSLSLDYTQVTDAGLEHLRELTKLESLSLNYTEVTDSGLAHLRGLRQLSRLNLNDTRVTDSGLMHLRGLTQLRELSLDYTQVTDAGVDELKKALPKARFWARHLPARYINSRQPP